MDNVFANKVQKLSFAIIIISLIGLITVPLFPWAGIEQDRYNYETDETKTVTEYATFGEVQIAAESSNVPNEIEDINDDIGMIALCFWLSLFFGIIAIAGVTLFRTGKFAGTSHILLLIGAIVIIFAILALVSHLTLLGHLGDLEDEMNDDLDEDEYKVMFGYNFIPLIMAVFLLLISLVYLITVVPYSGRALSQMGGQRYPPAAYQQYPQQPGQYQPPQQYPPQYPQQPPPQYPQQPPQYPQQ